MHFLFVDDAAEVLNLFTHILSDMSGIHHQHQTLEQLSAEILQQHFDVLLLDGQLANGIKGWDVLRLLRQKQPNARCIGFSSDPTYAPLFLQAGAVGFVGKDTRDPAACVGQIRSMAEEGL